MPYCLTSPIIPFSPDGIYSYPYKSMLIPHEALRREILRAKEAIDNFDPWKHPWKAEYLNEWFNIFFVPLFEIMLEINENLFIPYSESVNIEYPDRFYTDIKHQLNIIEKIGEIIHDIYVWIKLYPSQRVESNKLRTEVEEIQILFNNWVDKQILLLNDNEVYWPSSIDRFGVKGYLELESLFVQYGIKSIGKSFHNFIVSILYAMNPNGCFYSQELGWANDSIVDEFLSLIPTIPTRMFYLSKWTRRYEYYFQLISATGETLQQFDRLDSQQQPQFDFEHILKYIHVKYPAILIRQNKKNHKNGQTITLTPPRRNTHLNIHKHSEDSSNSDDSQTLDLSHSHSSTTSLHSHSIFSLKFLTSSFSSSSSSFSSK